MARVGLIALYDRFSIGLGSLRSFLQSRGHQVFIVYFKRYLARKARYIPGYDRYDHHVMVLNSGNDVVLCHAQPPAPEETARLLAALRPLNLDLVGISFRSVARRAVFGLTAALRESIGVPVVYGGIGPTIEPEACILENEVLCRGEGEHALSELAEALERGLPTQGIQNLWFRRADGVERNPLRPLIRNLDELPAPDYDPRNTFVVDEEGVRQGASSAQHSGLYEIMTSRGCPFSCTFCCNSELRSVVTGRREKYVRRRSVENVLEELVSAKGKHGVRYVNFQDDVFTFDREWLRTFCGPYRERVGVPFWCYVHPSYAGEASLRLIRDAGVQRVTMGVQSGSETILREVYNRATSRGKILESCRHLHRLGISFDIDVITNNPLEREADCRETLDLLMQMPAPVRFNGGLSKLTVYPATKIREIIDQRGAEGGTPEETFQFFNTLYLLCQTPLPRPWIRAFRDSAWLRKHPAVLKGFLLRPWLRTDLPMGLRERLPRPVVRFLRGIRKRGKGKHG